MNQMNSISQFQQQSKQSLDKQYAGMAYSSSAAAYADTSAQITHQPTHPSTLLGDSAATASYGMIVNGSANLMETSFANQQSFSVANMPHKPSADQTSHTNVIFLPSFIQQEQQHRRSVSPLLPRQQQIQQMEMLQSSSQQIAYPSLPAADYEQQQQSNSNYTSKSYGIIPQYNPSAFPSRQSQDGSAFSLNVESNPNPIKSIHQILADGNYIHQGKHLPGLKTHQNSFNHLSFHPLGPAPMTNPNPVYPYTHSNPHQKQQEVRSSRTSRDQSSNSSLTVFQGLDKNQLNQSLSNQNGCSSQVQAASQNISQESNINHNSRSSQQRNAGKKTGAMLKSISRKRSKRKLIQNNGKNDPIIQDDQAQEKTPEFMKHAQSSLTSNEDGKLLLQGMVMKIQDQEGHLDHQDQLSSQPVVTNANSTNRDLLTLTNTLSNINQRADRLTFGNQEADSKKQLLSKSQAIGQQFRNNSNHDRLDAQTSPSHQTIHTFNQSQTQFMAQYNMDQLSIIDQKRFQEQFDAFQAELQNRGSSQSSIPEEHTESYRGKQIEVQKHDNSQSASRNISQQRSREGSSRRAPDEQRKESDSKVTSLNQYDDCWIQADNNSQVTCNQASEEGPSDTLLSKQSIFQDAMKLGGALMQLLNTYKGKHLLGKQRAFERWKVQTLLQRKIRSINKQAAQHPKVPCHHPQDIVIPAGQMQKLFLKRFRDGALDLQNAERLNESRDDFRERAEELMGAHTPSLSYSEYASQASIQTTQSIAHLREQQRRELHIRKALQNIFRYRSRQISARFNQWKYQAQFHHNFISEFHQFQKRFITQQEEIQELKNQEMLEEVHWVAEEKRREAILAAEREAKAAEENLENMTDDEEDNSAGCHMNQNKSSGKRAINELETKLPFSAALATQANTSKTGAANPRGQNEAEELMHAHQQLERVNRGLKPAVGNFSKPLPRDKELLYTEILQSSNKDFHKLFNNQGDGEDVLPEFMFNDNRMSPDSIVVENMLKDDTTFGASNQYDEVLDDKSQKIVKSQQKALLQSTVIVNKQQRFLAIVMAWQMVKKLLNVKVKKSFFKWFRAATQLTCQHKIMLLEQRHEQQLNQSKAVAIIIQLSRRRDILLKSQSFQAFKDAVNINIQTFPEGETWHILFEEKQRFVALIKKFENSIKAHMLKGKEQRMFDSLQRGSPNNSATYFQTGSSGEAPRYADTTPQDAQPAHQFTFTDHTFGQGQLPRAALSLDDFEFLKENLFKFQDIKVPSNLIRIIHQYNKQRQNIVDKQRGQEIEQKVRSLCYDMVLDVLDQERQLKAQKSVLASARSPKSRAGSLHADPSNTQSQGVQGMNMTPSSSQQRQNQHQQVQAAGRYIQGTVGASGYGQNHSNSTKFQNLQLSINGTWANGGDVSSAASQGWAQARTGNLPNFKGMQSQVPRRTLLGEAQGGLPFDGLKALVPGGRSDCLTSPKSPSSNEEVIQQYSHRSKQSYKVGELAELPTSAQQYLDGYNRQIAQQFEINPVNRDTLDLTEPSSDDAQGFQRMHTFNENQNL